MLDTLTYQLRRAYLCHFVYVRHIYLLSSLCTCTSIFEWRGYANYQMLGNGDIRSLHMLFFLFLLIYFGYDVPACGSRVPLYLFRAWLSIISVYVDDGYFLIGVWWLWTILIFICTDWWLGLAGSRHWSTYTYWLCDFFRSAPRPYIRTGWSVVHQIDGPCQFFRRNWKSILSINEIFRKTNKKNKFDLILSF